jgi:hypothetical protein
MAEAGGRKAVARTRRGREDADEQEQEEAGAADAAAGGSAQARELAAQIEDALPEIDRVLQEACGFGADDIVGARELDDRAGEVVGQYVQKGGQ